MDNYVLFVLNDSSIASSSNNNISNPAVNSSVQSSQTQLIPLIGKFSSLTCSYFIFSSLTIIIRFDIDRFDTEKEAE